MKKRYIFTFPPESIDIPITYILIKHFDIKVNILNADLSSGKTGHLIMDIEASEKILNDALNYAQEKNIICRSLHKQLSFNSDKCVACGSCTAVCFSGALDLDRSSWQLNYNPEKCVVCGLCIKACPLQLFNLEIEHYV